LYFHYNRFFSFVKKTFLNKKLSSAEKTSALLFYLPKSRDFRRKMKKILKKY